MGADSPSVQQVEPPHLWPSHRQHQLDLAATPMAPHRQPPSTRAEVLLGPIIPATLGPKADFQQLQLLPWALVQVAEGPRHMDPLHGEPLHDPSSLWKQGVLFLALVFQQKSRMVQAKDW